LPFYFYFFSKGEKKVTRAKVGKEAAKKSPKKSESSSPKSPKESGSLRKDEQAVVPASAAIDVAATVAAAGDIASVSEKSGSPSKKGATPKRKSGSSPKNPSPKKKEEEKQPPATGSGDEVVKACAEVGDGISAGASENVPTDVAVSQTAAASTDETAAEGTSDKQACLQN
jgi:hypothetical protein